MKIDFEFETKYGIFRDALHLPDNHTLTESDIDLLKKQRLDTWIAILEAPSEPEVIPQTSSIEISGEVYEKLETIPPTNAKLIQIEDVWYYKV